MPISNQPGQQAGQPVLIIIRGLPGSGKSYLAGELYSALTSELPATSAGSGDIMGVIQLDPDATDYDSPEYAEHVRSQTAAGVDPKLHAYRFLRAKAHQAIERRQVIIWNQPFTNLETFNKVIANLQGHAMEHDTQLAILVVEVQIDPGVARSRVMQRKQQGGHGPSDATFARFTADYRSFAPEGYHVVAVNGNVNVKESVRQVLRELSQL